MRKSELTLFLSVVSLIACREAAAPAPLPTYKTPIPEKSLSAESTIRPNTTAPTTKEIRALLNAPLPQRVETLGALRWVRDFDAPITYIRWSPLKGFVVSVGNTVHNITSRGEDRWRVVGGEGHRLFSLDETEVLFSPAFKRLSELKSRGLSGWNREWSGQVMGDAQNDNIYLFDASTVAAIGLDGQDKWRVVMEGVRQMEGPFACRDGLLVDGMSGLKRVAAQITARGSVARTIKLGRGALLLNAAADCEPLVWRQDTLELLDHRGHTIWKRDYPTAPFVTRLENGFAMVSGRGGAPALYEIVDDRGQTLKSGELPVSGRLTHVAMAVRQGVDIEAMGLCLDVTHPCSKPGGNRGPFNALVTADGRGAFRTLIRHTMGHLGFTPYPGGGFAVASSKNDNSVDVERRDSSQKVMWQLTLSGRLSAGPYIGPYGSLLVATCAGWECGSPYRLFAITAERPPPEQE